MYILSFFRRLINPFQAGALFLTFSLCLFSSQGLFSQQVYQDYYDGTLYLKIREEADILLPVIDSITERSTYPFFNDLIAKFEVYELDRPFKRIKSSYFFNTYQLKFSKSEQVDEFIRLLSEESVVEFAEKVPIMRSFFTPNDPYANNSDQWFLSKIKAYQAWDIHKEGDKVVLAIVDDAVRWDHEDLDGNFWINQAEYYGYENYDDDGNGYIDDYIGWDAANWDNNPAPPPSATNSHFSHGTHCAGIAAGRTHNGDGIASISYNNALIMACKGKHDNSSGSGLGYIWEAFEYAAVNGADIISCSWGGGGYSNTHQNLINWATNNGSIVVAAAGNENTSSSKYPAAYNYVIAVANTTPNDTRNPMSNYGSWVDISAPGTDILSCVATTNGSYEIYDGTSMACPMVAGLLAQMKSFSPSSSNNQIVSCLFSSADNINSQNPAYVGLLGAGRINAQAALQCLGGGGGGGDCHELTLTFTLDDWGGENTWAIYQNGNAVASGGPFPDFQAGLVIEEEICLEDGCYELVVFDEWGDGMCCSSGNGSYILEDEDGNVLASGGEFQDEDITPFCLPIGGGGGDCPAPSGLVALQAGYAHLYLDWDAVNGADKYQTRQREAGSGSWDEGNWFSSSSVWWGNMTPCTQYEIQVRAECDGSAGSWSSSIFVTTDGCNDPYCYSYGLTWDDWIARVEFGSIDNETGKNYGFGNFTDQSTQVAPGDSYPIQLTADTDDDSETAYWRVWIDFNQDEDFEDSGEMVFQASGSNTQKVSGTISIPSNAAGGTTRMRVSMDINGYADPCETGSYRAVEDYSISIGQSATLSISPASLTVPANETAAQFTVSSNQSWSIDNVSGNWVTAVKNGNIVNLSFSENSSSSSRNAQVTVETIGGSLSKTFNLTQEGAVGSDPYLSASADLINLNPTTQSAMFGLYSNTNWSINVVSNSPWVGNISPQFGDGNATINIPVQPNNTAQQRVALLEITGVGVPGLTITLVQKGAVVSGLTEKTATAITFKAYPNPARDFLNIELENMGSAPTAIVLMDAQGRQVKAWNSLNLVSGQPWRMDVSDLPVGMYVLRLQQGERIGMQKVMVAR